MLTFAFKLQGGGLYEAIVECDGLFIINSTGHQYLRVRKVPTNHTCTSARYYTQTGRKVQYVIEKTSCISINLKVWHCLSRAILAMFVWAQICSQPIQK